MNGQKVFKNQAGIISATLTINPGSVALPIESDNRNMMPKLVVPEKFALTWIDCIGERLNVVSIPSLLALIHLTRTRNDVFCVVTLLGSAP
jgi:hypothetical protein